MMHYLTVQDLLWINFQVTKQVHTYDFATLEEASFYQYGYGASTDLRAQATRFLSGFIQKSPIAEGNEATAFVGFVGFLRMNGYDLTLSDDLATEWLYGVAHQSKSAEEVAGVINESHDDHHSLIPNVKQILESVLSDFKKTVASVSKSAV